MKADRPTNPNAGRAHAYARDACDTCHVRREYGKWWRVCTSYTYYTYHVCLYV